jgi:signal transduction histidine kinase
LKKYNRVVYILYAVSILIIIGISLSFYYQLIQLKKQTSEVDNRHQVINQIEKIRISLVSTEANQRAFLIRKDSSLIESKMVAHKNILDQLLILQDLLKNNSAQLPNLVKLKNIISSRFQLMQRTADDFADGTLSNYEANFQEGLKIMKDFNHYADLMEDIERKELQSRLATKESYESAAPFFLLAFLLLTCLFQLLSFVFISREMKMRHQYQKELENKIKDLHVTNAELEQIAFVASHDLQEPLRKIRTFTDLIVQRQKQQLDEESHQLFSRLTEASIRMQGLMEDLVNYTSIIQTDGDNKLVNLDDCVTRVLESLKDKVEASKAMIERETLPQIIGQPKQLQLLFYNLIDNALKFTKPNVTPVITITTTTVTGGEFNKYNSELKDQPFIQVTISDNGIGFDESFAHKIFIIFQRLHTQNSSYSGKGIGLAICKRVMMNHNGFIYATGTPGAGATFDLYFPVVIS